MTNINCTCDCIYQKDGKCSLDEISIRALTPQVNCAYFLGGEIEQKNT